MKKSKVLLSFGFFLAYVKVLRTSECRREAWHERGENCLWQFEFSLLGIAKVARHFERARVSSPSSPAMNLLDDKSPENGDFRRFIYMLFMFEPLYNFLCHNMGHG